MQITDLIIIYDFSMGIMEGSFPEGFLAEHHERVRAVTAAYQRFHFEGLSTPRTSKQPVTSIGAFSVRVFSRCFLFILASPPIWIQMRMQKTI